MGCVDYMPDCWSAPKAGVYKIKPGSKVFEASCDPDEERVASTLGGQYGGWMLIAAYFRNSNAGSGNPKSGIPLVRTGWPPRASHNNGVYTFTNVNTLGVAESWIKEVRLYCDPSRHSRNVHFKSSEARMIRTAYTGQSFNDCGVYHRGKRLSNT